MQKRFDIARADEIPQFEKHFFYDNSSVYEKWKTSLPANFRLLPERYWMLRGDQDLKVSGAVGQLMLGIAAQYPEFDGIGSSSVDGSVSKNGFQLPAGFIGIIAPNHTRILNTDRTVANLVEATNEQLLALNSLYHLPL